MDHHHKTVFRKTYHPGESFEFHAKLKDWLVQYWNLQPEESLALQEIACDDNSCPVFETILMAYLPGRDTPRILKLGKPKHLITKQDVYFSCEKQK